MAAITIADLPLDRHLDARALSSIRGGGAPWVFGWIRPHVPGNARSGAGSGFVQVNNYIYADQIINQVQVVDIANSGAGSVITVGLGQQGANAMPLPARPAGNGESFL